MTDTLTRTTKTVQLRRYRIADGRAAEFVQWWAQNMPPLRTRAGFSIEFAYMDHEGGEFVWAVSLPGDLEEFARVEEGYMASPERAALFDSVDDDPVTGRRISIVEVVR